MTTTRIKMALFAALCLSLNAFAQYDDEYDIEEWTLDEEEEIAPKPQRIQERFLPAVLALEIQAGRRTEPHPFQRDDSGL